MRRSPRVVTWALAATVAIIVCTAGWVVYGRRLVGRTTLTLEHDLGALVGERVALALPYGKVMLQEIEGLVDGVDHRGVWLRDLEGRTGRVPLLMVRRVRQAEPEPGPSADAPLSRRGTWWRRWDGLPASMEWSPRPSPLFHRRTDSGALHQLSVPFQRTCGVLGGRGRASAAIRDRVQPWRSSRS